MNARLVEELWKVRGFGYLQTPMYVINAVHVVVKRKLKFLK